MPEVHVPVAENRLSAPSPAPSATVPSAPDTVQPAKTFIDTLREKHRTDDLLVMVRNEYRGGAYENALRVYDSLPEPQQRMTEALLYKLRTLQARGDTVALAHLLKTHSVDDGEFVLAKGIHAYETARYGDALELLERSKRLPRLLMPYEDLKQEVCYYKSLSATGIYDTNPTEENYRDALHEWWQLKSLLRTEPNHEYHERILSETQRMGRKHRQAKGS